MMQRSQENHSSLTGIDSIIFSQEKTVELVLIIQFFNNKTSLQIKIFWFKRNLTKYASIIKSTAQTDRVNIVLVCI